MNKREKDRVSSLLFLAVAIGICIGSIRLSLGDFHRPGPGFFSFFVGAILGLLSAIVFWQSFKELPWDEKIAFWPNPKTNLKVGYVLNTTTQPALHIIMIEDFKAAAFAGVYPS
jgi:hypothetical protein